MKSTEEEPLRELTASYCEILMTQMDAYRQTKSLCDVNLVVEGATFQAHRIVLAVGSPYFHGLFTSEMKEKQENKVVLKEVKAIVMENVLEYLYTGKTDINSENAEDLMTSSCYFLIDGLKEKASSFLRSGLNVENCLKIREFSLKYDCQSLKFESTDYIIQHFGEVIEVEDFLKLGSDTLEEFIANEKIVVNKEEQTYEALKKWVEKEPSLRKQYFESLFKHIRLSQLSRKFLNSIVQHDELVTGNVSCIQYLLQSMNSVQSLPPIQRPRKCLDACVDAVIISGGLDDQNEPTKSTVCFVTDDNNSWYTLSPLSSARFFNALVYCDGFLYSVGGFKNGGTISGQAAINSVERYDPVTNSWLNVCPLPQVEYWVTAVSLDGQVYVYGASGCMYRYTPSINIWTHITSTSEEICSACLVTDSIGLYLVGGFDSNKRVMSACQKFDPESEKWTLLTPMNSQRYAASAVYKRKHIYVVGGCKNYGDRVASVSCEVYSIDHDVWENLPSLEFPRSLAGIVCVWDDILILGGFCEGGTPNNIEHYNEAEEKWEVLSEMPCRGGFSCSWVRIPKQLLMSQNKILTDQNLQ